MGTNIDMPNNHKNHNNNWNSNENVREVNLEELEKEVKTHGVGNRGRLSGNLGGLPGKRNQTPPRFTRKASINAPRKHRRRHRFANHHDKALHNSY